MTEKFEQPEEEKYNPTDEEIEKFRLYSLKKINEAFEQDLALRGDVPAIFGSLEEQREVVRKFLVQRHKKILKYEREAQEERNKKIKNQEAVGKEKAYIELEGLTEEEKDLIAKRRINNRERR